LYRILSALIRVQAFDLAAPYDRPRRERDDDLPDHRVFVLEVLTVVLRWGIRGWKDKALDTDQHGSERIRQKLLLVSDFICVDPCPGF
jgi:hypothetical protein